MSSENSNWFERFGRCCEEDFGGSHYHCARCSRVTGYQGCKECVGVVVGYVDLAALDGVIVEQSHDSVHKVER